MKKLLLTGAFALSTFLTANAQDVLFNVDFTDLEALSDWYLMNADGDNQTWNVVEDAEVDGYGAGIAFSASWTQAAGALTPDNSLITQAFELPANGGYASFKIGGIDPQFFQEHYAVYVVADDAFTEVIDGLSAEPATATVEDYLALLVDPLLEETIATAGPSVKNIDLADFSGQTVRIVFRHFDVTDMNLLLLDDVSVTTGTMSAGSVIASQFSVSPNPANNIVTVANANNALVTGVSVADVNGRVVKNVSFASVSEAQINVSDLSNGVYMMTISSDKGAVTKKIVKN
ncbi:hypothetical protein AM493_02270 [Flavobacterium akiainvivens]|uniref:Secretion system C-terminal sorting domain-containing protein n=1 Tax=Flavobacterium akiainvivens TaxID=1202724 RepID=A0A0M8MB51_9FLAO|nr:T9SS type A sorting domain-containing protein [Flavobacterium akiainvivens]KOS04994.1 hypothetical protein AM493_02270 [Flavobacterium akiainvivens]SFQ40770.1 Por secretion system C-terminal sorting domain-containing protein [Flavobacterium akiainvivens]